MKRDLFYQHDSLWQYFANITKEYEIVKEQPYGLMLISSSNATDCTHTNSVQSSKPSHAYPIIRLRREFRNLAESKAVIYQKTHNGKLAFLVAVNKKVDNSCLRTPEKDTENRLSQLESQISDLKSLILHKDSNPDAYKENKRPKSIQSLFDSRWRQ